MARLHWLFEPEHHNVQRVFKIGAKMWSDLTCVNFFEDKYAKDKVVVVKESGSSSSIGRCGGDQLLSIGENSPVRHISISAHEIGHVLGLFHTMSRYDRDGYIRIIMENVDVDRYEVCSANQKPTMIAIYPQYQKTMGSDLISFSDVFMINEHYGCNEKCNKSTSAKCVNEGYPHPRNCSICICPRGHGGALCDRRPPGCGEDLVATRRKRTVVYRLGSGSDLRDQFDFCNYIITAPEGKKIEVDIRSISNGYDEAGCPKGGVEIKAQEDQKLTGYRFCSKKGTSGPVVSSYNRLPVILFNRRGTMEVKFTHRYIG
ncbi:hypothetical protein Angca_006797 [Angiostrongylus cantonensis]|nr:hypothetical protein Angca_006797 [Angiostrongylus cantonensis]